MRYNDQNNGGWASFTYIIRHSLLLDRWADFLAPKLYYTINDVIVAKESLIDSNIYVSAIINPLNGLEIFESPYL